MLAPVGGFRLSRFVVHTPEFAQDSRVLNRLSGHTDSKTRKRVYQDPQIEWVQAHTAQARRGMRQYLRREGGSGAGVAA